MAASTKPCAHPECPAGQTVVVLRCAAQTNSRPAVYRTDGTGAACWESWTGRHGQSAKQVRKTAKAGGWDYLPGYRWDLCPSHAESWRAAAYATPAQ